jgi:2-polyprenyl-3-methyl-5-hydroxy-6-metoxy-1,4-benzoquinol methylase
MGFCCPLCFQSLNYVGEANYDVNRVSFKTPMYSCNSCDVYVRDIDNKKMMEHFQDASYTRFENETMLWERRKNFFNLILSLIKKHFKITEANAKDASQIQIIDFGSAYGHFLKIATESGFKITGVEVSENLIKRCNEQGFTVVNRLDQVPEPQVDVVTFIDSICCLPNPREVLSEVKKRLKPDGIVVLRDCNRNLYAGLKTKFQRQKDLSILGGAIVSYSLKSLKKLFEDLNDFEIIEVIPDNGFSKNLPLSKRMLYSTTYLLTKLSFNQILLTPGIIIIAKPKQ